MKSNLSNTGDIEKNNEKGRLFASIIYCIGSKNYEK